MLKLLVLALEIRVDGLCKTIPPTHIFSKWLLVTGFHLKILPFCLISLSALSYAAHASENDAVGHHLANITVELLAQANTDQLFLALISTSTIENFGLDSLNMAWHPWTTTDHQWLIRVAWVEPTLSLRSMSSLPLFNKGYSVGATWIWLSGCH